MASRSLTQSPGGVTPSVAACVVTFFREFFSPKLIVPSLLKVQATSGGCSYGSSKSGVIVIFAPLDELEQPLVIAKAKRLKMITPTMR